MKTETAKLEGAALDWLVAKCEGYSNLRLNTHRFAAPNEWIMDSPRKEYGPVELATYAPSTDWEQGGPIIEREEIELHVLASWIAVELHPTYKLGDMWEANIWPPDRDLITFCGPTPLTAAMRCYVASKLGDEVEVPDGLVP